MKTSAIVASRRNDDRYLIAVSYEDGTLTVASRWIYMGYDLEYAVSDPTLHTAAGDKPSLAVAIETLHTCDPVEIISAANPEYVNAWNSVNAQVYNRDRAYSHWMLLPGQWQTSVPGVRVGPNWGPGFTMGRNMPPPIVIDKPDYTAGLQALAESVEAVEEVTGVTRTKSAALPTHFSVNNGPGDGFGVRVEHWTIHGENWQIKDVPVIVFDDGEIRLAPDEGTWT